MITQQLDLLQGSPGKPLRSIAERFNSFVDKSGSCWVWTGNATAKFPYGYGRFWMLGEGFLAHRLAYEFAYGPISTALELDHLCRNRLCVNPAHLEPVPHSVNMKRSPKMARYKEFCKRGHTIVPNKPCLACKRIRGKSYREASRG